MPGDESEFSWNDTDSVIIKEVSATAVYLNPNNDVVIRQQNPTQSDDAFIIIPKQCVKPLITRLKALAKEAKNA